MPGRHGQPGARSASAHGLPGIGSARSPATAHRGQAARERGSAGALSAADGDGRGNFAGVVVMAMRRLAGAHLAALCFISWLPERWRAGETREALPPIPASCRFDCRRPDSASSRHLPPAMPGPPAGCRLPRASGGGAEVDRARPLAGPADRHRSGLRVIALHDRAVHRRPQPPFRWLAVPRGLVTIATLLPLAGLITWACGGGAGLASETAAEGSAGECSCLGGTGQEKHQHAADHRGSSCRCLSPIHFGSILMQKLRSLSNQDRSEPVRVKRHWSPCWSTFVP